MWVQSLGWKDPLEKEMAAHSSTLAWEIPWTEESGGLQFTGLQRVGHDLATKQQHSHLTLGQLCFVIYTLFKIFYIFQQGVIMKTDGYICLKCKNILTYNKGIKILKEIYREQRIE